MLLPSDIRPNPFLPLTEFGLTAIAVGAAFIWPHLGAGFFERMERSFTRLSRRSGLSIYLGVTVVVLRLALLPWFPIPLPFVPDDFSFLLACETFAHGHLTNPTPAMWTHFESVHIDMLPTYQSMYFRARGCCWRRDRSYSDGHGSPYLCWMGCCARRFAGCWRRGYRAGGRF